MTNSTVTLRPYTAADEDAAIELWRRTWQKHYPHLNFTERVPWWRERWRKELVPVARVVVAEAGRRARSASSPSIRRRCISTRSWSRPSIGARGVALTLLDEAKRLSPQGPRSAGQQGQRPRHPLLREARLCLCRRGQEPGLGQAGEPDGVAGVDYFRCRPRAGRGPIRRALSVLQSLCHSRFPHCSCRKFGGYGSPPARGRQKALRHLELQLRQPRIEPAGAGERGVRALLDDAAVVDHQDAVAR